MTALEIAAIEHLLAVCQRVHADWGQLAAYDLARGHPHPIFRGVLDPLLDELSEAQSYVEDLLVSQ